MSADLFGPGWLDRHLDRVVAELRERPSYLRPRLTGERAIDQPGIDRLLIGACDCPTPLPPSGPQQQDKP